SSSDVFTRTSIRPACPPAGKLPARRRAFPINPPPDMSLSVPLPSLPDATPPRVMPLDSRAPSGRSGNQPHTRAHADRTRPLRLSLLALTGIALFAAGCQERAEFVPPPPPDVTVAVPLQRPV